MISSTSAATRHFDALVIGAGPAGSAAAVTLAAAGHSVALIDKRHFPRPKLCGGGLTGRALRHHERIFGSRLPDIPLVRCQTVAFHAFGEDLGETSGVPPLHLGMRRALDHHLVNQALAKGAADFTGKTGSFLTESNTYRLKETTLHAPIVIAADGVSSPIAKQLFGSPFDRRSIGFALEVESPQQSDAPLRIDFGAAEWGYGWSFPKATGTTIGVGGVLARNLDMKGSLARYLGQLGADPRLPVKGQFLPFGSFRKRPGTGTILLAGDAAGLVDPITGEGIGHALHSGELAALAAMEALAEGRPERALPLYQRKLLPIHRSLSQASLLRNMLFQPRLRPAFIRSFRGSRSLRTAYFDMMAGDLEYGDLLRHVARRIPGFALRAMLGK